MKRFSVVSEALGMPYHRHSTSACIGYILLAVVCSIVYSNTLNSSWHLDDFPNIVNNPLIHISDLSVSSLLRSSNLFMDQNAFYSGIPYRPVAFLSFALNWYAGGNQVTGYHIVNILIHILCAGCLYFLLLSLFESPRLTGCFQDDENSIALLAAILWAVHPIQTQAVNYIVQRMALMAALFYLLGMICYVQARMDTDKWRRSCLYTGCACCLALAVGSKENAVIFPLSVGLIEIIFFQDLANPSNRKRIFQLAIATVITTIALGLLFAYILKLNPITFIHGLLKTRSYTLTERLLTEPRVVIGYLLQIFYPVLSGFSIDHSITVSTSLLKPITTTASLLSIIGLLVLAIFRIQKSPILSFAILFYFLNHIIESTILPLELIFEHRNYLPSLFIFFPIAAGAVLAIRRYRMTHRPFMLMLGSALLTILIVMLGVTTYLRNNVWASEKTLWEDALLKAPDSSRPYGRLAYYYDMAGQHDLALRLYEASLTKKWARLSTRSVTLSNMARIYADKQDYEKSIDLYDQSFSQNPDDLQPMFHKARLLITMERWNDARQIVDMLLKQKNIPWDDLNLMGLILLKENDPAQALDYFRRALNRFPHNPKIYINIGISMSRMGYYQRADWFLFQARQMTPENIIPLFCLIANHAKAGNSEYLKIDMENLFRWYTVDYIMDILQQIAQNKLQVPISTVTIAPLIAESMRNQSNTLWR
jgi:tetratricopeptide (TPR) repeat protein